MKPQNRKMKFQAFAFMSRAVFKTAVFLMLWVPPAESAFILQTKNKQALIDLEGLKTKKGAYFTAVDMYGDNRGFVQIKKVGTTKAIGILTIGRMGRGWSLVPVSRSRVLAVKKAAKKKSARRIAGIRREKIKNSLRKSRLLRRKKLAAQRRRESERMRMAEMKRRQRDRYPASYDSRERDWDDFEDSSWRSYQDPARENNRYPPQQEFQDRQSNSSYQDSPPPGDYKEPWARERESSHNNPPLSQDHREYEGAGQTSEASLPRGLPTGWTFGATPRLEYNFMRVGPRHEQPYTMKGFGWGLSAFADVELNHFMRMEGALGFKKFSVSIDGDVCGQRRGCSFQTDFLYAGGKIKLNAARFQKHRLWMAIEGDLMYLINESNNVIKQETLDTLHGSLGLAIGIDWNVGPLILPLSVSGGLYMPPSKTIIRYGFGLQTGLGYRF